MMDRGRRRMMALLFMGLLAWTLPAHAAEKVIFDTDFTTIGDDGQAFVMLAQAHAAGSIELLGQVHDIDQMVRLMQSAVSAGARRFASRVGSSPRSLREEDRVPPGPKRERDAADDAEAVTPAQRDRQPGRLDAPQPEEELRRAHARVAVPAVHLADEPPAVGEPDERLGPDRRPGERARGEAYPRVRRRARSRRR